MGTLRFSVLIPKQSSMQGRRPNYISPSTVGMTIAIANPSLGTTPVSATLALTPASPGCGGSGGTTVCTITVPLAACPSNDDCYQGTIATYDQVTCNASGCSIPSASLAKPLSENQGFEFSIAPNVANTFNATLDGVPASVQIVPNSGNALVGTSATGFSTTKCLTAPQIVSVVSFDADGNQIVGPGAPQSTLTSSDSTRLPATASSTPSQYSLVPPSQLTAQTIPAPGYTVQLSASVTTLPGVTPATTKSTTSSVTFNNDTCGILTLFPAPVVRSSGGFKLAVHPFGIAFSDANDVYFTSTYPGNGNQVNDYEGVCTINTTSGAGSCLTSPSGNADYCATCNPKGIVAGSDGTVYWTESESANVGSYAPAGATLQHITIGSPGGLLPQDLTFGSDGNLWVANASGSVTRLIPGSGAFSTFGLPWANGVLACIAAGPDGALWFTDSGNGFVGSVTTAGTFRQPVALGSAATDPVGIVTGADQQLYVATQGALPNGGYIFKVNRFGTITKKAQPVFGPATGVEPQFVTLGPSGVVWFTESAFTGIGSMTAGGSFRQVNIFGSSVPQKMVTGPDGNLWYADDSPFRPGVMRVQ